MGALAQPPPSAELVAKPEAGERDDLVLRALEADIPVPEALKAPHGEQGVMLTPLQRGSFMPRVDEYLNEVVPPDISDEEEQLRWRELRTAEKTYEKKIAKRKPGRAVCQGVPIDARGHDWMKIPGQGAWECLECGLEASIGQWNLDRGKMREVGAYKTDRAQKMFKELGEGNIAFMLPPGAEALLNDHEKALLARRTELIKADVARPEVPEGFRDDPFAAAAVKSLHERSAYEEGKDGVCLNCGSVRVAHKPHMQVISGNVERERLACPQHGVDAT